MNGVALLVVLSSLTAPTQDVSFTVGKARFTASLSTVGDGGLFWIRSDVTGTSSDFIKIIDDVAFEGLRLKSFPVRSEPDARIVFAEYNRSNWTSARFFLVRPKEICEVLGFSHRDQDALQLIEDKAGNLVEVRFDDRWIGAGLRPVGLRSDPAPGKRWCLTSKFKPSMNKTWKAYSSKWHAIPAP